MTNHPSIALVLSGGGARGAYEAGTVRYLREELPSGLGGKQPQIDILSGTSVGAVNASYLAATLEHPEGQGRALWRLWASLTLEEVYGVDGEDLWTLTRKLWRAATTEPQRPEGWRLHDLLHPKPLERMVRDGVPWDQIGRNLNSGLLKALSVSATQISTGNTVVFVQRTEGDVPPWSRDPYTEARAAVIGPEHVLASSSIPLFFRSVKVDGDYYCDGGLRQNTPLSPALRLGAQKVLLVSLKHRPEEGPRRAPSISYPTTPALMGKVLNALLLDHTDYDLDRLRRFNDILKAGRAAYGDEFIPRINETVQRTRGQSYRLVEDLVLRPSRDIAIIASQYTRRKKASTYPSLATKLLHRVARSQLLSEADLASYLLFDGGYTQELMELAMEDAHSKREALIHFFSS